jgi:mRNA-degrading endonuclease toxin of MazEF toxin-antitoxin module
MNIFKGEIWKVNLSDKIKEGVNTQRQLGVRPCYISSNNLYNKYSPTVQIIPFTSQEKKFSPVHVYIPMSCGLTKVSTALVEKETDIDKTDLIEKIGECSIEIQKEIERAIQKQKGMVEPFDIYRVKKLTNAIIQVYKNKELDTSGLIKSALLDEFKWYCGSYGYDYKLIFNKYKNNCKIENNVRKLIAI